MNVTRRQRCLLFVLLAIGLMVRIYGAWLCRHDTSTDRGRVGIMALHMAQGRDFPAFFYGGAYLGSFEPAVSAFMIRQLGPSGFALNLGPALLAFLLLPLLYQWARELGGPAAGMAAAALTLVGPFSFFFFAATPRGGYTAALLFGSMTLWLAGRIVFKALNRQLPASWETFLIGAAAGLAWWSHTLSAATLIAAAAAIALAARLQLRHPRYALGVLAFFLGSAPWWLWNASHDWASLRLAGTLGGGPGTFRGLRLFFGERLLELLDLPAAAPWLAAILTLGVRSLLAFLFFLICKRIRDVGPSQPIGHAAVILLFVITSALVFSRSHFARIPTTRYLLPLWPVMAVAVGALLVRSLHEGPFRWMRIGIIAAAVVWQVAAVRAAFRANRGSDAAWVDVPQLTNFCKQQGIEVLCGNIWQHWINFASREDTVVCDLMSEPYVPYARLAERATSVGLLGDYENLSAFLRATDSRGSISPMGHFTVQHDFTPPSLSVQPLERMQTSLVADETGRPLPFITDHVVGAGEDWTIEADARHEVLFRLAKPVPVCGVRLRCREHYHPWRILVEGRAAEDEPWQTLLPETPGTLFFWSGPRWYWFGLYHRQEYRWRPATVRELRICFLPSEKPYRVALEEIVLLGPADFCAPPTLADAQTLTGELLARGARRVYADRWLSAQLAAVENAAFAITQPPFLRRTVHSLQEPTHAEYVTLQDLEPGTVFVTEPGEADTCAAELERLNIGISRERAGPWVIITVTNVAACDPAARAYPGLEWAGQTLYRLPPECYVKHRAAWRIRHIGERYTTAKRDAWIRRAVAEYSGFARFAQTAGEPPARHPPTLAEFNKRTALINCQLTPSEAHPGRPVRMTWSWMCPSNAPMENRIVFVHIKRGDFILQDDHPLLDGIPREHILYQPFPDEIFEVTRTVNIPADAPPGSYEIWLGIYDPRSGVRERPRTARPARRRAVLLPVSLTISRPLP